MPLQVLRAIGSDHNPYKVLVFGSGKSPFEDSGGDRLFRLSSGQRLAAGADARTFRLLNGLLVVTLIES